MNCARSADRTPLQRCPVGRVDKHLYFFVCLFELNSIDVISHLHRV